jgi:prophage maintenance system killer protein
MATKATMAADLTVAMARTILDAPTRLALMSVVLLLMLDGIRLTKSTQQVKQLIKLEEALVIQEIRLHPVAFS